MASSARPRSQSPTSEFPSNSYLFSCMRDRVKDKGLSFGPQTDKVIAAAAQSFGNTEQTAEWVDRNSRHVVEKVGLPPATSMYHYERWGRNLFDTLMYCQQRSVADAKSLSGQES